MKSLLYLLTLTIILTGCSTSKKYLQRGQYDQAIYKAVKKIRKKPTDRKNIEVLEKAYPLANSIDFDRINFLKKEGRPEVWDEVFDRLSKLKSRQDIIKSVAPIKLPERTINFEYKNYDNEIIEAKKKAAEYFYVHGKSLLQKGDKYSARDAYYDFKKVKSYYSTYEDVDEYLEKSRIRGMSYALVGVINNSHIKLPADFKENLISQDYLKINGEWLEYDDKERTGIIYDYNVNVNIKIIDVSPEGIKEEHVTESKEIKDGFVYALDNNGNVMKDSLGNDIKIPKTKTIICYVIKTFQHKAAHLEGEVQYYNINAGKIIKTQAIAADQFFDNIFIVANGDLDALSESTKKMLGSKPLPFPTDFDMIFAAGDVLKKIIFDALYNNKNFLK
ncbi:MAG: hypothetical protein ABIJ97_15485 [Bacteroidota bacterium]